MRCSKLRVLVMTTHSTTRSPSVLAAMRDAPWPRKEKVVVLDVCRKFMKTYCAEVQWYPRLGAGPVDR
jgi:hypothetical protein